MLFGTGPNASVEEGARVTRPFPQSVLGAWCIGRNVNAKLTLFFPQDVENLTSIADLEALIGDSEVVLIFLSAGYFSRWNCLREAREALVAQKDLILMREVAVMHGTIRRVEL
jgi:hypothetical protein